MSPGARRSRPRATGYPIAKVAAKLAVGYTLDEIPNDLRGRRRRLRAALDYVVVKFPRLRVRQFPGADRTLGDQMGSPSAEAMGIGRSFTEAFLKASVRGGRRRLEPRMCTGGSSRGLDHGPREVLAGVTDVDRLVADDWVRASARAGPIWTSRRAGGRPRRRCRAKRRSSGVRPVFRRVDSCAGEVEAASSTYYYSTWGEADEAPPQGTVHGS